MGEPLRKLEPGKEEPETIQDVFVAFEKGEITRKDAVERIEELRSSRHGPIERYLAYLAKKV